MKSIGNQSSPIAIAFVNSEAVENLNQEVGETRLVQNDKWDKAHLQDLGAAIVNL